MGTGREYGKSKRDGEAVLELNGRPAEGEEESEIEEGMRSKFQLFLRRNIWYFFVCFSVVAAKLETAVSFIRMFRRR
jgi:hypothetical protein